MKMQHVPLLNKNKIKSNRQINSKPLVSFINTVFTLKGKQTRITNTLPDSQDIIVPHDKTGKPNEKLIQNVSNKMLK